MSKHNEWTLLFIRDDLKREEYAEIAMSAIHRDSRYRAALLEVLASSTRKEVNSVEKALDFLLCERRRRQWCCARPAKRNALIESWVR